MNFYDDRNLPDPSVTMLVAGGWRVRSWKHGVEAVGKMRATAAAELIGNLKSNRLGSAADEVRAALLDRGYEVP